jgi:O-antigen ligase
VAYATAALIISTGAFLSLFINFDAPTEASEGSGVLKVFWATVYLITVFRVVGRRRIILESLRATRPLVALVALTLVSAVWSLDPGASVHQAIGLCFGLLFAIDFSTTYSSKKQLQIVCIALLAVVGMSVLLQLTMPQFVPGSDLEGTAWHGVFARKNEFGRAVCVAATATLTLVRRSRWRAFVTIGVSGVLAALSRSVSAMLYLAAMIGVTEFLSVAYLPTRARKLAIGSFLAFAVIALTIVATNFNEMTLIMGKDPHMTGRSDLWSNALLAIADRPLLGYGYQAFWGVNSEPARVVRQAAGWEDAPHAHNGYIDLTLSIGLVGLILYLTLVVQAAKRAAQYLMAGKESYRRWPLACLILLNAYQISETTIVTGNSFFWLMLASLSISLAVEEPAFSGEFSHEAGLYPKALPSQ